MSGTQATAAEAMIERAGLDRLLARLAEQGYRVVGPTVRDRAIVYDDIASVADLPEGWTDRQEAGEYRLERRSDAAVFGYAVGPQSWKRFLHPPALSLWRARREGESFAVTAPDAPGQKFAFIGVRACELRAIAIQDRVFLQGQHVDVHYRKRREGAFIVAVNCATAGGTCFCVSMKAGPQATFGFDIALTELTDGGEQRFLAQAGSEIGTALLQALPQRPATAADTAAAQAVVERTARSMGRHMPEEGVPELLRENLEHPRWDEVAGRCLTCGNCTMVCPTCFCTTVEEVSALTGEGTERMRHWASCFTLDFSYLHGGSVRASAKSRYRQWLTHKLSTWVDQFGTSGCVGCGRCISWCPVGIDITEEVRAISAGPDPSPNPGSGPDPGPGPSPGLSPSRSPSSGPDRDARRVRFANEAREEADGDA